MADATLIDSLFAAVTQSQTSMAQIAKYSLIKAASLLQEGNETEAVAQLKRCLALDPTSLDAYNTLGSTYLKQGKTKEAIEVYKRLISQYPTSADAYNSLGNAYVQAGNQADAEKAYKTAARMDGASTYAPYTLGNMYVQQGRLSEADAQFRKVIAIAPRDAHGYYGLSMVYNKEERYSEAAEQAEKSILLDRKFAEPHFELGAAYLGLGDKDSAYSEADVLKEMDGTLYSDLTEMLRSPKILASLPGTGTLPTFRGPGTLVSSLDPSLMFPNTSKDFSVIFQFDAEMDASSVMDITKWSISKASGGTGGFYNSNVTLHPETQVTLPNYPRRVVYDPDKMQATVFFTVYQNSAVDAEIDPSHLLFKFSGVDSTGKTMDTAHDEFDGFASKTF
ncbi:tetratricopeptide repeat protein [Geomonas sp. RF6]|uniref:tetratricopeptide repeat protein n=1 Tax=Geomonas sp. RF6 TaxID=2897342 RepID=UPI001E3983CD|nr:tetratricopeptide repeat protein [Geomonas sp. RF6]UFS70568.1 tetratricopeptide repeat protein [Geomonas sp. RF6]